MSYDFQIDKDGKLFCEALNLYGFSTVAGIKSAIRKAVQRNRQQSKKAQQVRGY